MTCQSELMKIENADKKDYSSLIEVWEQSVRATHDFLPERDIKTLKPLILEHYFDAVELKCVKNESGDILGFSGVHADNIEMLFIAPAARGKGIGASLARYAIEQQNARKVDVNEQNGQALGFYLHLGFTVVDRSPLDGQGNPYPLLHMALKSEKSL